MVQLARAKGIKTVNVIRDRWVFRVEHMYELACRYWSNERHLVIQLQSTDLLHTAAACVWLQSVPPICICKHPQYTHAPE